MSPAAKRAALILGVLLIPVALCGVVALSRAVVDAYRTPPNRAVQWAEDPPETVPPATVPPTTSPPPVKRVQPTASPAATRKPVRSTPTRKPSATRTPTRKPTRTAEPRPVSFANCTELRKVYPNGVSAGHPAYRPKMDRDKDGRACERD